MECNIQAQHACNEGSALTELWDLSAMDPGNESWERLTVDTVQACIAPSSPLMVHTLGAPRQRHKT